MIIKKITTGFVIQSYDTEKKDWISQEFEASDEVEYEYESGKYLDSEKFEKMSNDDYLPFLMVQPQDMK